MCVRLESLLPIMVSTSYTVFHLVSTLYRVLFSCEVHLDMTMFFRSEQRPTYYYLVSDLPQHNTAPDRTGQ